MAPTKQLSSLYGQALLEFIEEMRQQEKRAGSRFYREVMVQASHVLSGDATKEVVKKSSLDFDESINKLQYRHQKTSKLRRVSEDLQPLTRGMSQFVKVADTLIQAAPSTAQLLYGAAKFVLQVAQDLTDGFDLVVQNMGDVGLLLQAFNIYAEAYEDSEDIRGLLVSSYKAVLRFWRDASNLFERKSVATISKSVVDPFTRIWSEHKKELTRCSERVLFSSQAIEAKLRKDRQKAEDDERKETLKTRLFRWISASESNQSYDVRPRLDELSKLKAVDTCRWLLRDDAFSAWNKSKKREVLWYNDRPGAGKSVTCAYLIKWLQEQSMHTIYFFCSFREPSTSSVLEMLRSLILQLLRLHLQCFPNPPSELIMIFRDEMEHSAWQLLNPYTAIRVFATLIKSIPRVHIVLDGLDELRNASEQQDRTQSRIRDEVSDILSQIISLRCDGVAKWFCSSRPDVAFEKIFCKSFSCLQISPSQESVSADIRRFLSQCPATTGHSAKCRERWVKRAGGNFLWVWLITRILAGEGLNTEEDIDIKLQEFPEGLEFCYARALVKLSERCSTMELNMAKRLYTLVAHSLQPLSISEIRNALAIRTEALDHSEKRVLSLEQLKKFCFPLFYFSEQETDDRAWVMPVHSTVMEFLHKDPSEFGMPDSLRGFFPSKDDANAIIGSDCLTYLKYSRYADSVSMENLADVTESDSGHAFLRYAAVFGYRHLGQAPHTREVFERYREFVRSSNFWVCVRVQSFTAPHLFVSLVQAGDNAMSVVQASKDKIAQNPGSVALTSPIPAWLEDYDEEGREIVQSYMDWVSEWHNAMAHEQGHVQNFPPMVTGRNGFFDTRSFRESRVSFKCLDHTKVLKEDAIITLGKGTQLSSSMKWKKVIGAQDNGKEVAPNLRATSIQDMSPSLSKTIQKLRRSCDKISISMGNSTTPTIPIALHRASSDCSSDRPIFKDAQQGLSTNLREFAQTLVRHSETAVAISTTLYATNFRSVHKSDVDSTYGSMEDESDDSDDESVADGATDAAEYHAIAASFGDDLSFYDSWTRSDQPCFRSNCIVHTDEQLIIWSKSPGYVNIGSPKTGKTISKSLRLLNEPADRRFQAMRYEFCIHESGDSIDVLIVAMTDDTVDGKSCSVFQSTLGSLDIRDALDTEMEELTLQNTRKVRHITTGCHDSELLRDTLVSWTTSHTYVLLPHLHCLPKIVRFDRRQGREKQSVMTLSDKLYLPASLPSRICTLFAHDYSSSDQTDETLFTTVLYRPQKQEAQNQQDYNNQTVNPVLVEWRSKSFGGWRSWDEQEDEKNLLFINDKLSSTQIKGKFMDSAQVFCLQVRSGLNWEKKAFLSCW